MVSGPLDWICITSRPRNLSVAVSSAAAASASPSRRFTTGG